MARLSAVALLCLAGWSLWLSCAAQSAPLQLATGSTPFSARSNPQLASVGGAVYLHGGINSRLGVTYGDTWLSADGGTTWTAVASVGLPVRYSGALVSLPSPAAPSGVQLVLFAGADNCCLYNDVYASEDGLAFRSLGAANFSQRQSFASEVALSPASPGAVLAGSKQAVFVLGGWVGKAASNDVWFSVGSGSGLLFVLATKTAPWAARTWHQAAAVQASSRLVVTGGTSTLYGGPNWFNDVWIGNVGGSEWQQLTQHASFPARAYFGMVSSMEQLFLLAGRNSSTQAQNSYLSDLWSSRDFGSTWQQSPVSANFTGRARFSVATVGNNIVVVGSELGDQQVFNGALITPTPAQTSAAACDARTGKPAPAPRLVEAAV